MFFSKRTTAVNKVGYARVSTTDPSLGLQVAKLEEADCDKVYINMTYFVDL